MQWQLERTERWDPQRLREHQFAQIRRLAAQALRHSAFYAGHLRAAGLSRVDELAADTFLRWPRISKRLIASNQGSLASASCPKEHGNLNEIFTTGSTGEPTRVVHTELSRYFAEVLVVRDHLWHARRLGEKFAAIRFYADQASQGIWSPATASAFQNGPLVTLGVETDVDAQLDWLLREDPAYLLTTPSNLQALVLRSRELGRVPRRLLEALTYAEMLPDGLRDLVRRVWQIPLTDAYSCREIGPLALQCPEAEHYHVQAENVYLEVLRDDGTPCAPGELGRVVVTPLHNFAMPLLRYELGDVAVLGEACPCGRGLPVIRSIAGRVTSMARDPRGRWFQPTLSRAIRSVPIRQFQAVQHELSRIEVRYVADAELTAAEARRLNDALRADLGYPFDITLQKVEAVERSRGGKFQDFICLLPDG